MSPDERLALGFLKTCGRKESKAGIKSEAKTGVRASWYGKLEDIDKAATQFVADSRGNRISALVLKAGKKLYRLREGEMLSASHHLSITDFANMFIHTNEYKLMPQSLGDMNFIQALLDGARFFTIVERVDSGLNKEIAFSLYGYESGMQITRYTGCEDEIMGGSFCTIATQEGEEESTLPRILLCGNYDETLKWITDNEFNPTCEISPRD